MLEKRPAPSDGIVEAAVEVDPPRPSVNPVAAGCCGAVDVKMELRLKPGAAEEEVVEVVRENGVADAVGLLKAKLKPVAADVDAGVPK